MRSQHSIRLLGVVVNNKNSTLHRSNQFNNEKHCKDENGDRPVPDVLPRPGRRLASATPATALDLDLVPKDQES